MALLPKNYLVLYNHVPKRVCEIVKKNKNKQKTVKPYYSLSSTLSWTLAILNNVTSSRNLNVHLQVTHTYVQLNTRDNHSCLYCFILYNIKDIVMHYKALTVTVTSTDLWKPIRKWQNGSLRNKDSFTKLKLSAQKGKWHLVLAFQFHE